MKRLSLIGLAGLWCSSGAMAGTDFGIRTLAPASSVGRIPRSAQLTTTIDLSRVASIGSRFGTVTSTRRSVEHNRRVGGVSNSYHLTGRAIDIARRAGVRHGTIAQAYREAGLQLIESLDEGDHSHFAFKAGATAELRPAVASGTTWRVVLAPH